MLFIACCLVRDKGLCFIVRTNITWEQERWLNNQDVSNNNEDAEGHREEGEEPLVHNPFKEDTEIVRGKADADEIPYRHARNSCNTRKACCRNCEPVQNKPSIQS